MVEHDLKMGLLLGAGGRLRRHPPDGLERHVASTRTDYHRHNFAFGGRELTHTGGGAVWPDQAGVL